VTASFHSNTLRFLPKKHKTHSSISWLQLNHPSLSKQSTGCTRQDLGSCCLLPTCSYVNEVCRSVSRHVKDGSCSSSSLSESQWTVLMGYLTISTNVDAINHITDDNFSFRKTAHCVQHSPTAAAVSTSTAFEWKCDFFVSLFCEVVQKHKLFEVAY